MSTFFTLLVAALIMWSFAILVAMSNPMPPPVYLVQSSIIFWTALAFIALLNLLT